MGCDGIFERYSNRIIIESIRKRIKEQRLRGKLEPQKIVNELLLNNIASENPGQNGGPIDRGTDNQTCVLIIF